MEELIRQAFSHVDVIGPHVAEGHYDLMGPNNEIILPGVWDTVIEPDWTVTMHMWPMPEKEPMIDIIDVPLVPDPPPEEKKKRQSPLPQLEFLKFVWKKSSKLTTYLASKKPVKRGFSLFSGPQKGKGKGKASASAAAATALSKK